MRGGQVLQVIGLAVQALGLWLAGSGLIRTYREHDATGVGFWRYYVQPPRDAASRIRDRTWSVVRRILRRPRHTVVTADAAMMTAAAFDARVVIGFGPIETDDLTEAIADFALRFMVGATGFEPATS